MFGNDKDIQIVVKMIDETQAQIKGLQSNLAGLDKSANANTLSFGKLTAANFLATGAMQAVNIAAQAVQASFSTVWDTLAKGGDLERVKVSTYQLGANTGYAASEIDKMVKSLEDTNTYGESAYQTVNTFIMSGLMPMVGGLKRVSAEGKVLNSGMDAFIMTAKDFGAAAGVESTQAIDQITTAIKRMSPEMLDSLGIQVNLIQAYEQYGKTLKKDASDLTVAERQQALLNAVMKEGTKVVGTYDKTYATAGKNLLSIGSVLEHIQSLIGEGLQPAFSAITGEVLKFSKNIRDFIKDNQGSITAWAENFKNGFKGFIEYLPTLNKNITGFFKKIEGAFKVVMKVLDPIINNFINQWGDFTTVIENVQDSFNNLFKDLGQALKKIDWDKVKLTISILVKAFQDFAINGIDFVKAKAEDWYTKVMIPLIDWIRVNLIPVVEKLIPIIQDIGIAAAYIGGQISLLLFPVLETLYNIVKWVWESIGVVIKFAWDNWIKPALDDFFYGYDVIKKAFEDPAVQDALVTIQDAFKTLSDTLNTIFTPAVDTATTDVTALTEGLGTDSPDTYGGKVRNMADDIKVATDAFINMALGIADTITQIDNFINRFEAGRKAYESSNWLEKITGVAGLKQWGAIVDNSKDKELPSKKYRQDQNNQSTNLPQFAEGTPLLKANTYAYLHKGEAVIPANNNPFNPDAKQAIGGGGNISININAPVYGVDNFNKVIVDAVNNAQADLNRRSRYNLAI